MLFVIFFFPFILSHLSEFIPCISPAFAWSVSVFQPSFLVCCLIFMCMKSAVRGDVRWLWHGKAWCSSLTSPFCHFTPCLWTYSPRSFLIITQCLIFSLPSLSQCLIEFLVTFPLHQGAQPPWCMECGVCTCVCVLDGFFLSLRQQQDFSLSHPSSSAWL